MKKVVCVVLLLIIFFLVLSNFVVYYVEKLEYHRNFATIISALVSISALTFGYYYYSDKKNIEKKTYVLKETLSYLDRIENCFDLFFQSETQEEFYSNREHINKLFSFMQIYYEDETFKKANIKDLNSLYTFYDNSFELKECSFEQYEECNYSQMKDSLSDKLLITKRSIIKMFSSHL